MTFVRFKHDSKLNDWIMETPKKVPVPQFKVVNSFTLEGNKILLMMSQAAVILDSDFGEVVRIKFEH